MAFVLIGFAVSSVPAYFFVTRYAEAKEEPIDPKALFFMRPARIVYRYFLIGHVLFLLISAFFFWIGESDVDMRLNGIFFLVIVLGIFFAACISFKRRYVFYEDRIVVYESEKKHTSYSMAEVSSITVDHRHHLSFDEMETDFLPNIEFYYKDPSGKDKRLLRISLLSTNRDKAIAYVKSLDRLVKEIH